MFAAGTGWLRHPLLLPRLGLGRSSSKLKLVYQ